MVKVEVSGGDPVNSEEVSRALEQILASHHFRNSHQCSGLLSYIVEHTLAGEENLLRERVIGSEVFGRPAGYEPGEDPVVRLRAADVRKRLAQYYLSESDQNGVQIDVPPGSYRAVFRFKTEIPATENVAQPAISAPSLVAEPPSSAAIERTEALTAPATFTAVRASSRSKRVIALAVVLAVLSIVVGAALFFRVNSPEERAFKGFWAPWANSRKPVIISVGSNAVYRLQDDYIDRYARERGLQASGREIFVPLREGDVVPANDLIPAYSSFVALGDVAAVSSIVADLTKQNKAFQERFPNDISFAELQNSASVLVGGFNNPMAMELTKHLEFVMRGGSEIDDQLNPRRKWLLHASADSRDSADYAILTRLVERNGNAPLMSVAGLGQYGTLATADLISDPTALYPITKQFGNGWMQKNLQVVLQVRVVDFKAAPPEIITYRSW